MLADDAVHERGEHRAHPHPDRVDGAVEAGHDDQDQRGREGLASSSRWPSASSSERPPTPSASGKRAAMMAGAAACPPRLPLARAARPRAVDDFDEHERVVPSAPRSARRGRRTRPSPRRAGRSRPRRAREARLPAACQSRLRRRRLRERLRVLRVLEAVSRGAPALLRERALSRGLREGGLLDRALAACEATAVRPTSSRGASPRDTCCPRSISISTTRAGASTETRARRSGLRSRASGRDRVRATVSTCTGVWARGWLRRAARECDESARG